MLDAALKGLFLGLILLHSLKQPNWLGALGLIAFLSIGLIAALIIAFRRQRQTKSMSTGRPLAYLLFLLLEHGWLVVGGLMTGLLAAVLLIRSNNDGLFALLAMSIGGTLFGGLLYLIQQSNPRWRWAGSLALAVGAIAAGISAVYWLQPDADENVLRYVGINLLVGLPFLSLLSFCGETEETEIDAAVWCVLLGLGLFLLRPTPNVPLLVMLIPAAMYFVYTRRILPALRVFKHTLRGMTYLRTGQLRPALVSLSRATQLEPTNELARKLKWEAHRQLNPNEIAADPSLSSLIDAHHCIHRAAQLLNNPPTPEQADEANQLLNLAESRDPTLRPTILYWRTVAALHRNDIADAGDFMNQLLELPDSPSRAAILFTAWRLALVLHPQLKIDVGEVQIKKLGRRREAILAVEGVLKNQPQDEAAWGLKRILHPDMTEAELDTGNTDLFDFAYTEQLGLALLEEPNRWRQGVDLLQVAARGLTDRQITIYSLIAKTARAQDDLPLAKKFLESARAAGLAALPEAEKPAYFAAVKQLAEDAMQAGDSKSAIGNWELFLRSDRAGVDTLRTVTQLYEQIGDVPSALRTNEKSLGFAPTDAELLERRGRYYYSVTPEQVRTGPDSLRNAIDVNFCLNQSRQALDQKQADGELLDWARHLLELADAVKPEVIGVRVQLARAMLRQGQRKEAAELLELVRAAKPTQVLGTSEIDAWHLAHRILGDLYLDELNRPDLALACFTEYRNSTKSGADTLFKLGRAYELMNEPAKAAKWYEQVSACPDHPLAGEARAAVGRLNRG